MPQAQGKERKVHMPSVRNVRALLSLLPQRPGEFYDRVAASFEIRSEQLLKKRPGYAEAVGWETAVRNLEERFDGVEHILEEPALQKIEGEVRRQLVLLEEEHRRSSVLDDEAPFNPGYSADTLLARWCYLACRLLEPDVFVETGVAYGTTSAFILKAMEENGRGTLHSVDLAPLGRGADRYVGAAIPEGLRGRWELHAGASRRVLPGILGRLGTVDIFMHDSLHSYRNMRWEFETVWPCVRSGGMILSDDVLDNAAFGELRSKGLELWQVVKDTERRRLFGEDARWSKFGVAIKR